MGKLVELYIEIDINVGESIINMGLFRANIFFSRYNKTFIKRICNI